VTSSFNPFGSRGNGGREQHGEEPVVIRDKRRIDPETGDVRDSRRPAGGESPFPSSRVPGDPGQASQPITAQVSGDSEEFAQLKAQLAERTSDLQRVTAEYANYRKRVLRDQDVLVLNAKASLAGELLAVLDDLELAKVHGDLKGAFKAVADRLVGTLEKAGLQGYGDPGDEFDPAHHEAVQFGTSSEVSVPTVTAVLRRGYSFKDRPLRAAVVAVTGPEHEGDSVSTPDSGASEAADAADQAADAQARSEQESKQASAPNLADGEVADTEAADTEVADAQAPAGNPAPMEDPE
jgi:molecular chaperone GrpE